MNRLPLIIIRGGGDLASGAAFRLFQSGFPVLMTELAAPRMVRRTVCFGEAIWDGISVIEGVTARRFDLGDDLTPVLERKCVGAVVDKEGESIQRLHPQAVVDARMLKSELPDQRFLAPCVIGLGPGFCAGGNVHFVIETMRGLTLGQVIGKGEPVPDTGVPGIIAGESSRRLIRAPKAGSFTGICKIGDLVEEGQTVGFIEGEPVRVSLSGRLRGLIRDGIIAGEQEKIGDVDPRGEQVDVHTVSDKSRAVGGGVLEAVMRHLFGNGGI